MSLITTLRAPGTGRRQADPDARLTAENQRLRDRTDELVRNAKAADTFIAWLHEQLEEKDRQRHAEVAQVARVLGEQVRELLDEREAHAETRRRLEVAIRANESNRNSTTLQTDVTALRAAMADVVPAEAVPVPQYRPYRRITGPVIRVVPLWASPQAAHPANIPAVAS